MKSIRRYGMVFAALLPMGCARHVPSQGPVPQPNPQPKVATDVTERVKQMREITGQVMKLSQQLPAADDAAQRSAMHDAFDLFAKVLPLLMGPEADGQFRLQQRIVADARDQLAKDGEQLAQEPTVDSGLRAVYNALVRISQESFYTSDSITADVTELQNRVDALDTVRGAMHRDATARTISQAAAVMDRMVRIYDARLRNREPVPAAPNPKGAAEQPVK